VDFFSTPNELQLDLVFLTKYAEWKYEREWRVIDHDQGPGSHAYDASQLSGVIFGMRMSEADKASIRTWMTQRGVSTKFYQASRSNDTFRVEMQEVT
jgi:hypothetical protein